MKKHIALSMLSVFILTSYKCPAPNQSISVIVNSNNPVDKMNSTIVRIYWLRTAKKRWEKINVPIKPADRLKKCVERDFFLDRILAMKDDQVEKYFTLKQYQYAELPPSKFTTDEEIIEYVGRELGAIAFVNSTSISPANSSKVKVVFEAPF